MDRLWRLQYVCEENIDWKKKEIIHTDIEQVITEHYQKLRSSDSSSVPQKMM
jgi:hypothetical protein